MELRVTQRLEYDGWNVVRFKDLQIGDIVRIDDIPKMTYRVDSTPDLVVNEDGTETMGFTAMPIELSLP